MNSSIYLARQLTDAAMTDLASRGWDVNAGGIEPPSPTELAEGLRNCEAAIVTLTEKITADLLDEYPRLRVIANVAVGFDNIDVESARERGIIVCNTPGVLDGATADLTFALILNLARRVSEADSFIRSEKPWVWGPRMMTGLDLSAGARLGIVGLGRIGSAVADRARAFGMEVVAYSPPVSTGEVLHGVPVVGMSELLATSDVVSLHCPLNDQTRHLIDAAALAQMKKGSYLVNVARGGVVDDDALADALESGHLAGAALDVFEGEPLVNPRLLDSTKTLLTPHIASAGTATRDAMGRLAIENVAAVLAGAEPPTPVRG